MMSAVVRGRQTSRLMLVAACTIASTWVFCTPANAQRRSQETKYLDLSSSADLGPGHLILSINRQQVPAGWSIDWYVALYSPQGIRVGLGRLADNSDGTGTIAVRVPAGRHRYEISRKTGDRTQLSGAFDFDKGHWVPPSDETVVITSGSVDIPMDGLVSLQLRYDAPSVSRNEDPKSHEVTVLMTLSNARTDIASATPDKLPASAISRHVLMKYAAFGDLAQRHVIKALLDTGGTEELATTALLKAKSIDAAVLTAEIQGAVGNPRWGLARVVAKTGDKQLVPPILRWLARTPTADHSPLLWALGELRDPAAVPVLREALTSSANVNRVYAAHALGRIADTNSVAALKRSLTDKSCAGYRSIAALADPEMNAFYALTPTGWTQVWPVPDWCVRFVAVHALGQIGGHEALDALVGLTRDSEERVRRASCMALSRFRDPASVEALAARITDDASVQFVAVAALAKIGTDAAFKALPPFATDGADELTKSTARAALERMKPPAKGRRPARPTF